MAIEFGNIPTFKYRRVTYRQAVKLPQGVAVPPNQVPPSVVALFIDWNVAWQESGQQANVAVAVNIQAASVQASILDRIASVKIDNTGSPNSVYVQFEDSGDVINCPPNCTVTFPCLTNLLTARIIILGLTPGQIPQTRIFLYNVVLPPAVDYEINQSIALYKASPVITRGNTIFNTNFGVPALGDQLFAAGSLGLTGAGNNVRLWNTPYVNGFLYINSLVLNAEGATGAPTVSGVCIVQIESTGVAGSLITIRFVAPPSNSVLPTHVNLLSLTGMQIKLDATQTWQLRVISPITNGEMTTISSFTQSPI